VNAATATTAIVTSAILLTPEPVPVTWLVVLAASSRPEGGPPGRQSAAVTASPFAARADQALPRIVTNPTCPLIGATSAAAAVVEEGGDQGLPVTALMTGRP
jgi:hypothetical protein